MVPTICISVCIIWISSHIEFMTWLTVIILPHIWFSSSEASIAFKMFQKLYLTRNCSYIEEIKGTIGKEKLHKFPYPPKIVSMSGNYWIGAVGGVTKLGLHIPNTALTWAITISRQASKLARQWSISVTFSCRLCTMVPTICISVRIIWISPRTEFMTWLTVIISPRIWFSSSETSIACKMFQKIYLTRKCSYIEEI